uniref:Uncharacterized protein n=1 Tax=Wolbachia endosymbiont of Oeneis ivallda TaxID=3171168 RepID=A0AAU7YLY4_9RICK
MVLIYKSNRKSTCQKELLQRATQKDVEIGVEEQINVTKADTQLCENININDEDFSILDATVVENVSNFSCIF